jgi:hypothetical protein
LSCSVGLSWLLTERASSLHFCLFSPIFHTITKEIFQSNDLNQWPFPQNGSCLWRNRSGCEGSDLTNSISVKVLLPSARDPRAKGVGPLGWRSLRLLHHHPMGKCGQHSPERGCLTIAPTLPDSGIELEEV